MPDFPSSSRPPAEPTGQRLPADATGHIGAYEQPQKWQTVAVVVLGVILVAVPLYLWRRPRSEASPVARDEASDAAASAMVELVDAAAEDDGAARGGVVLGDARVIECRDPGAGRTPAEQCDHLAPFEKSLSQVILDARDCVPPGTGAGTITYLADLSFAHHKTSLVLSTPKDGRSLKAPKVVVACAAAVRRGVSAVPLDALTHAHAHYKIAITATYPDRSPSR